MVTDVSPLSRNAHIPTVSRFSGNSMLFSDLVLAKASASISFTLSGSDIFSSALSAKVESLILSIPSGSIMFLNPDSLKLQPSIYETVEGITRVESALEAP